MVANMGQGRVGAAAPKGLVQESAQAAGGGQKDRSGRSCVFRGEVRRTGQKGRRTEGHKLDLLGNGAQKDRRA